LRIRVWEIAYSGDFLIKRCHMPNSPRVPATLSALGVVFGDLGTSPLYTLQTVVGATGGQFTAHSALGVLSLIVWTLIVTISVKYCLFVMRADNRGEGGILALMSLIGANGFKPGFKLLTGMGLLGAALIYGDGVITPAISVLSALEGVNAVTTTFKPFVMPVAVVILLILFAAQRFGTATIGRAFGPREIERAHRKPRGVAGQHRDHRPRLWAGHDALVPRHRHARDRFNCAAPACRRGA